MITVKNKDELIERLEIDLRLYTEQKKFVKWLENNTNLQQFVNELNKVWEHLKDICNDHIKMTYYRGDESYTSDITGSQGEVVYLPSCDAYALCAHTVVEALYSKEGEGAQHFLRGGARQYAPIRKPMITTMQDIRTNLFD